MKRQWRFFGQALAHVYGRRLVAQDDDDIDDDDDDDDGDIHRRADWLKLYCSQKRH